MELIDVTLPMREGMPVWPGEPGLRLEWTSRLDGPDGVNSSRISCGSHTGTHVDAPKHFLEGGASAEDLPLDALVGPATVARIEGTREIGPAELAALDLPPSCERLLLRTPNSELWGEEQDGFVEDFAALTPDGARWMVERGVRLVGVDYLSVELFEDPEPVTHRELLGAGVVALEGLDLREVEPGEYTLFCLPLKVRGAEAAPARVVLGR